MAVLSPLTPAAVPGAPVPGQMPGAPMPGQMPGAPMPGQVPGTPMPSAPPSSGLGSQAQLSINSLVAEMGGGSESTPPEGDTPASDTPPESKGLPQLDEQGVLKAEGLEAFGYCATMLSGRPLIVHVTTGVSAAKLAVGADEIELSVQPFGPGLVQCMATSTNVLNKLATKSYLTVDPSDFEPPPPEPDVAEVPELSGESDVQFQTFMHFRVQHRTNLLKGALVVKATNIPPGTQRSLRLVIPGVSEEITVSGSVAFQGDGTIGFMVGNIDSVAAKLAEIAARKPPKAAAPAAPAPAPRRAGGAKSGTRAAPKGKRSISWSGKLQKGQIIEDVWEFSTAIPSDLNGCDGWLARVLHYLFEKGVHGIARFAMGEEKVDLWVHDGAIVFSRVEPVREADQLGRVLVLQKKLTRASLGHGLERAKEAKQPLGRTLVGMGEIEPGALNAALRQQILDRVFRVAGWDGASVEIGQWEDPDVRTGLVMTSGKAIVTNLLREVVRRATNEELEEFAEPYLERTLKVQIDKIEPSFALRRKERKFYEKAAMSNVPLRDIPKTTAVQPGDSVRMIALGRGLGLVDAGEAAAAKTQEEIDAEIIVALDEQIEEMGVGSHFDVLVTHWTSTDEAIPKAYKKAVRSFEKHMASENKKIRKRAEKALDMVEVAYEALATADQRTEYRNEIVPDYERKQSAEHMIDQAELLMLKDDFKGAEKILRQAQEVFMTPRIDTLFNSLRGGGD